jgi:hypothetical protein
MPSTKIKRFTQFDAMEARGDFEANGANAASPNYAGPVEFPRLVYFAEEEVIASGSYEDVKGKGFILLGEQKALRNRTVRDRTELADALADGWFDHPAKALKALIEDNKAKGLDDRRVAPAITAQETIDSYERRIAELEAKLAEGQGHMAEMPPPQPPAGRRSPRISALDP